MRFSSSEMLAALLAAAIASGLVALPAAADNRVERRASEMALPDPYLDPTWPEENDDSLNGRYEPGDSDSVEDIPLDEETELQSEQREAMEAGSVLGADPSAVSENAGGAAPPATGATPAAAAAPAVAPLPDPSEEILPGDDGRDPVEW